MKYISVLFVSNNSIALVYYFRNMHSTSDDEHKNYVHKDKDLEKDKSKRSGKIVVPSILFCQQIISSFQNLEFIQNSQKNISFKLKMYQF